MPRRPRVFVEGGIYLEQLAVYIHLNPVSACVVDDPSDDPLCGHRELLRKTAPPLIDADQTLSLFGGTTRTARRRYVRRLEGARDVEWQAELPGRLPWWGREPDRPIEPEPPDAWIDERGVSTGLERPSVNADDFLSLAAEILKMAAEKLTAPGSGHQITRVRSLILALADERWHLSPSSFAPLFRRRNDVVSRWVRWGVQRRMEDQDFRSLHDDLDHELSRRLTNAEPVD